jgi:hypothetical protein
LISEEKRGNFVGNYGISATNALRHGWLSKWATTCVLIMLSRYETPLMLCYRTCKYNLQSKEQQLRQSKRGGYMCVIRIL